MSTSLSLIYLRALTPAGKLHASTCADAEFEQRFRATMQRQGLRVEAYTLEEYRTLVRHAPALSPTADLQEAGPPVLPVPDAGSGADRTAPAPMVESIPLSSPVPVGENPASGLTLPVLGQEVVHPVIGFGRVTHTVTLEGQALPVVVGPRGSGLVRPGQWRPALGTDVQQGRRTVLEAPAPPKSFTPDTHQPAPAANHDDPPTAGPKPSRMPSLF